MEGGERKRTRRERWWDEGKRVNPVLVEQTGGIGWGELVEAKQHVERDAEGGGDGDGTQRTWSEAGTMAGSQESMASS